MEVIYIITVFTITLPLGYFGEMSSQTKFEVSLPIPNITSHTRSSSRSNLEISSIPLTTNYSNLPSTHPNILLDEKDFTEYFEPLPFSANYPSTKPNNPFSEKIVTDYQMSSFPILTSYRSTQINNPFSDESLTKYDIDDLHVSTNQTSSKPNVDSNAWSETLDALKNLLAIFMLSQSIVGNLSTATTSQSISGNSSTTSIPSQSIAGSLSTASTFSQSITGNNSTTSIPSQSIAGNLSTATISSQSISSNSSPTTTYSQSISVNSSTASTSSQSIAGNSSTTSIPSQSIAGNLSTATISSQSVSGNSSPTTTYSQSISGNSSPTTTYSQSISGNSSTASIPSQSTAGALSTTSISTTSIPSQSLAGNLSATTTSSQSITSSFSTTDDSRPFDCGVAVVKITEKTKRYTRPKELPWMVMVIVKETPNRVDNAVLIHPKVVAATAHHMKYFKIKSLKMRMGQLVRGPMSSTGQERRVVEAVTHPKHEGIRYDIGLWILDKPFVRSDHVNTLCIPIQNKVMVDIDGCVEAGWDRLKDGTQRKKMTRTMKNTVNNDCCNNFGNYKVKWDHFCAIAAYWCTCAYRQGAPLACPTPAGRYELAGFLVWRYEDRCEKADNPKGYCYVSKFSKWIRGELKKRGLK